MEFQFRRRVESVSTEHDLSGLIRSPPDEQERNAGRQVRAARQPMAGTSAPTGRLLRRPRHSGLFTAVHRLDAALDETSRRELAGWIREQYSTEYGDIPLGFLATCYLGPPYGDHRLDLIFSIVEHYAPDDVVPYPFAQARMLVRAGGYAFVELYASGAMVPVRDDGTPVTS